MIRYVEGFKYQLAEDYTVKTPITGSDIDDDYFRLLVDGTLLIRKGYAWDGASGPTFDTKSSMRASLVHDFFCQVMRDGRLPFTFQKAVNDLFYAHCIEGGMWSWRALLWRIAVSLTDAGNPNQGPDRTVIEAP